MSLHIDEPPSAAAPALPVGRHVVDNAGVNGTSLQTARATSNTAAQRASSAEEADEQAGTLPSWGRATQEPCMAFRIMDAAAALFGCLVVCPLRV